MQFARLSLIILLLPAMLAAACTPLPDIPPLRDTAGPPPVLVPLDALMARIGTPRATDAAATALVARAARLRARAALMRGPVLDPETRRKLAAAIARGAA